MRGTERQPGQSRGPAGARRWLAAVRRLWQSNKGIIAFLLLMALFRSAIADWNRVPSGSMLPTIREGDRILVDKMAYDLRVPFTHVDLVHLHAPQRGDIVTIDSAAAHELLVKRIIGVPGDTVSLLNNVLTINGRTVRYEAVRGPVLPGDREVLAGYMREQIGGVTHAVRLAALAPSPRSSFGPVTVPPASYLMLGDNRDDSADSRYFGYFQRREIMGRVGYVAYSLDPDHFDRPRFTRFGARLDGARALQ
jgi:signal peptidase I